MGDQNPGPEAPPRSNGESRYVRVIEEKEVRGDDPIEYFLPIKSEVSFESQRG